MSVVRNASWLALGQAVTGVTNIVFPAILARVLVKEEVGFYKQIDLAANLIIPFLVLGFDKSVTYFVPRKEANPPDEISGPLYLILAASLVALAFALLWPDGFATFGTAPNRLLTAAGALGAAHAAVGHVLRRALVAVDEVKTAAILPTILSVPRAIALIITGLFFASLEAVLWVVIASSAVSVVVWVIVAAVKGYLLPRLSIAAVKKHIRYGGPLAFAAVIQSWAYRMDRYLVTSLLGADMFAVYSYGKTRVPFLPIVSRALGDATSPRFSELESKGKYKEMAILFRMSVEAILPFGLLMSLFFCTTAHWTIPLVFSDAYIDSVPIFRVFSFAILLQTLIGAEQVLRAMSAIRFLVWSIIFTLPIRIFLGMYLIEHSTLTALALSDFAINLALFLVRMVKIKHGLNVPWSDLHPFRCIRPTLPLAVIGLVFTYAIDHFVGDKRLLSILLSGIVWSPLALIAMWNQGVLTRVLPPRILNIVYRVIPRTRPKD